MEMTLYDLLDTYEYSDLESSFRNLYDDKYTHNEVAYEKAFERLKECDTIVDSDYSIMISHYGDINAGYDIVSGIMPSDPNPRSLLSIPFNEWLGMRVDLHALENYSSKDILCHCLYDMTFHGLSEEQVSSRKRELMSALNYLATDENSEELDQRTEEIESQEILKQMLKYEIESSSSSEN